MQLPVRPLTRLGAALQVLLVTGALFAWIAISTTVGVGILGSSPLALVGHVALTGLVGLAAVFVATAGDESRVVSLGLSRPTDKLGTAAAALIATGGTYLVSALVTVAAMGAVGGKLDVEDKYRAMQTLSTIPLWAIAPVALFAGFNEEVLFRGFLLSRFRAIFGDARRGLIVSVVLSSVLFSAGHGYQGLIGVVQTFVAGACFATVAAVRRSLWPSIFAHAAIDLFGLFAVHYLVPLLEKALAEKGFHFPP